MNENLTLRRSTLPVNLFNNSAPLTQKKKFSKEKLLLKHIKQKLKKRSICKYVLSDKKGKFVF